MRLLGALVKILPGLVSREVMPVVEQTNTLSEPSVHATNLAFNVTTSRRALNRNGVMEY
jgi:hypothetical protein